MAETGWQGATELSARVLDLEQQLTAANDRISDLERIRRTAKMIVQQWPGLKVQTHGDTNVIKSFDEWVAYLSQSIEGRPSIPPPADPKQQTYDDLYEVLIGLWQGCVAWKESGELDSQNCMQQMFELLQDEMEDEPTHVDRMVPRYYDAIPVLYPIGHSYKTPVLGSPAPTKPIKIQRLRCEDDGPLYPDGPDEDGFPGGDQRFKGEVPLILPQAPEWRKVTPNEAAMSAAMRDIIRSEYAADRTGPIPLASGTHDPELPPIEGCACSECVRKRAVVPADNPHWPMGNPKKQRPRRTADQEKTFRQLDKDVGKLNEMGIEQLEWLRSLQAYEMPTTPERIVSEFGGPANGRSIEQRLADIEHALFGR